MMEIRRVKPVIYAMVMALGATAASAAQPPSPSVAPLQGPLVTGVCMLSREAIVAHAKVGVAASARIAQLAQQAQAEVDAARKPVEADVQKFRGQAASLSQDERGKQEQALAAAQELSLVLAAKGGSREAFGKLAQQYQRQCAAVALRLLGNAHDAAELVQDALVKAFRSLDQLRQMPGNRGPMYSREERRNREQGVVSFLAYVTKEGRLAKFRQVSSTGHSGLDQKTLEALQKWKFYPGQEGWVELPFKWDLKGDPQALDGLLRGRGKDVSQL